MNFRFPILIPHVQVFRDTIIDHVERKFRLPTAQPVNSDDWRPCYDGSRSVLSVIVSSREQSCAGDFPTRQRHSCETGAFLNLCCGHISPNGNHQERLPAASVAPLRRIEETEHVITPAWIREPARVKQCQTFSLAAAGGAVNARFRLVDGEPVSASAKTPIAVSIERQFKRSRLSDGFAVFNPCELIEHSFK